LADNSKEAKTRAEASFKKKEQQAKEGAKAMLQYQAERHAVREKTARLKTLRLAKEAADKEAADQQAAAKQAEAKSKPPAAAKKPPR
jgi:hypothetical protein